MVMKGRPQIWSLISRWSLVSYPRHFEEVSFETKNESTYLYLNEIIYNINDKINIMSTFYKSVFKNAGYVG